MAADLENDVFRQSHTTSADSAHFLTLTPLLLLFLLPGNQMHRCAQTPASALSTQKCTREGTTRKSSSIVSNSSNHQQSRLPLPQIGVAQGG